jgi:replicative DNA helicase
LIELYSLEAEENVLGALLIDEMAMADVIDILSHNDFHREKTQSVFEVCQNLFNRGERINQVTVTHELARLNKLTDIDGASYISGLIANCATSVGIESYAKIVADFSNKRALLAASKKIEDLVYTDDIEKAYGDALGVLLQIKMSSKKDTIIFPEDSAEYALNRYSKLNTQEEETLLSFGLPSLDKIGGMQGGEVLVVSGKTGHGKTTLAKQIYRHVMKKFGFVLYVSLEMPQPQDMDMNIARLTGEYVLKIQRGHYTEQLYGNICDATGKVSEEKVCRYFPSTRTLPHIYAAARKVQAKVGLKLIVVDYIQLIEGARGGNLLEERMSNISRNLKYMAMDLNIPVIALSRMTRDKEADDINRLYGSGALEYDADWVLFMKSDIEKNTGTITISKHRMGGIKGEFEVNYDWRKQEYSEVKAVTNPVENKEGLWMN